MSHSAEQLVVEYAPKLSILGERAKRIKILVGGRGSTKSTFVADWVVSAMSAGQLWCCAREYQNTIDESVHRLIQDEIERIGLDGFSWDKSSIWHESGGRAFYRGLARNPTGIKSSLTGVDGLWIEEGETLSADTLRHLSASLRLSALDAQRSIEGEDVKLPELWITLNRGSSQDPIAQTWLKRAEAALARTGVYEDDQLLVVQINYDEVPRAWFLASGLETERADDERNLSAAAYDHKWNGAYNDTVANAIIDPSWFDACVDAHKQLGIEPRGIEVVSHDPSDEGSDPKGLAHRHGILFTDVQEHTIGDINAGGDWATDYAERTKPDVFIWDADGLGVGLRRQINAALGPKRIAVQAFKGSAAPDNPHLIYEDGPDSHANKKTNRQTFKNKRAQYYWALRDRCHRTWQAVTQGKYHDPDQLVSFSSGIAQLDLLRSQICRVPLKYGNGAGLIQIATKPEMARLGIPSPNMADAVMMNLAASLDPVHEEPEPTEYLGESGWMY